MKEKFSQLKFLVIDEADMFLNNLDDDKTLKEILAFLPLQEQRITTLTTASYTE